MQNLWVVQICPWICLHSLTNNKLFQETRLELIPACILQTIIPWIIQTWALCINSSFMTPFTILVAAASCRLNYFISSLLLFRILKVSLELIYMLNSLYITYLFYKILTGPRLCQGNMYLDGKPGKTNL